MAKAQKIKSVSTSIPKIKHILITQPRPESEKSPYFDLARKHNVEIDFHSFIRVEGLSAKEFRKQRIDLNDITAVVFVSRNAVDHFFRICDEMKFKVSQELKYFCVTESVALYLQKFILYRKRKVFFSADGSTEGLVDVITKYKDKEKFLLPVSEHSKNDITPHFEKGNYEFHEAVMYRTVSNDVSEVLTKHYDLIVFFSPFSVDTLLQFDAKYQQNDTVFGAFGNTTSKAIEDVGLNLLVKAPAPNAPSMVAALDQFLEQNK